MYPWSLRCFVCWRNDTFIGTQPNALQQYSSLHIPTAHLIYMYRIEWSLDLTFHLTFHVTLGAMPRNMTYCVPPSNTTPAHGCAVCAWLQVRLRRRWLGGGRADDDEPQRSHRQRCAGVQTVHARWQDVHGGVHGQLRVHGSHRPQRVQESG